MSAEGRSSTIRRMRVPGKGEVPVRLGVRLVARHVGDGRQVAASADLLPEQTVELAEGIGQARLWLSERAEPDGALALRLRCRAALDPRWVLYEAALTFATDPSDWKLLLPSGWGRELADVPADLDFVGNYPGWSALAQLAILQGPAGGLSVSARDAGLELKELRVRRDADDARDRLVIEIARVPEKRDAAWHVDGECDVLLAAHAGGWEMAAAEYRARQEQVRPQLKTPRPLPALLEADPIWLVQNCFVFPPHPGEQTVAAAGALHAPVLCHLYNWQDAPFDTRYPDWVGFRPTAVDELRALFSAGIPAIPYVNARIWDRATESWARLGGRVAVHDFQGQPVIESYPTTASDFTVACPSQHDYQDQVLEVCRRLADSESNLGGIYLDQLGAAFGLRCYCRDHGHPAGGARSWNAGQRAMVERIRAELAGRRVPETVLTTENASEPLVDLMDGFLYYCGKRDDNLGRAAPLWHAIYGDHGAAFGDYFDDDLDLADGRPSPGMLGRLARQAIFGNGLGWMSPAFMLGRFECVGELIRNARSVRLPIRPFFRAGRLCSDALDSTGRLTGVFQSAWRRERQTAALAVNPTEAAVGFAWPDGRRDTLEPFAAKRRRLD